MDSLLTATLSCLEQGKTFLQSLGEESYQFRSALLFDSTIGGHFRHNLDHNEAFLGGYRSGRIDYDLRPRDPQIENDPLAAIEQIDHQTQVFELFNSDDFDLAINVKMDDGGKEAWSCSSVRRELQFLLSHTIHHYALIVAIAKEQGIHAFPDNFGIAPSTLKYREIVHP